MGIRMTIDVVGIDAGKVFKFMDGLANMISDAIYPQVNPRITFETISAGAAKTFEELKKNPRASSTEIGNIIGVTSRAVKKHFAILKEYGLIEYVGSQKGGHWIIKEGK